MSNQFEQGEYMPNSPVSLIINEAFGPGGPADGLGPETLSDLESVNDVAKPDYVEQLVEERWLCMDDGMEVLGGQLPGGMMISEVAGAMMDPAHTPKRLSQAVAHTTKSLADDGIEVWMHGDTIGGKAGCAANKFMRQVLALGGHQADVIAPLAWAMMEKMDLHKALARTKARQFCVTGAERTNDESLWDMTPEEVAATAEANGARYHELDRQHKTACTRFDLSPYIFNNGKFRHDHQTEDGLPLGAFSISLGAYRDSLANRAERHGHKSSWIAEKVLQAAIFSIAASKKLGSPQLRLAVVG